MHGYVVGYIYILNISVADRELISPNNVGARRFKVVYSCNPSRAPWARNRQPRTGRYDCKCDRHNIRRYELIITVLLIGYYVQDLILLSLSIAGTDAVCSSSLIGMRRINRY